MIALGVEEVAAAVGARIVVGAADAPERHAGLRVETVSTDSRRAAGPRTLFVALRTGTGDGHAHLAAAVAGGAVAALVEREDATCPVPQLVVPDTWEALRRLAVEVHRRVGPRVVAITGSYGKTTTKDLIAAALATRSSVVASPGSFNNELGVPLTMLLEDASTEVVVAEIGARHPGDIAAMAALVGPDVAVVTAVAGVHLEVFGTIEAIARTKGELVASLDRDGVAVLNGDDERVRAMAATAPSALLVSASGGDADVVATHVTVGADGRARARVRTPWGDTELEPPLAGRHQVGNGLLALAAAGVLGVPMDVAAGGIAAAVTSRWRSEVVRAPDGLTVINDAYNASPPTVLAALELLAAMAVEGRRWAVLGEMAELGPGSSEAHRRVGAACADLDGLVVVGAAASAIADGAIAAGLPPGAVLHAPDPQAALRTVAPRLTPRDAVLVKGSRVAGLERVAEGLLTRPAPEPSRGHAT